MKLTSHEYFCGRTGDRDRLLPYDAVMLEDLTTAALCDLRIELDLNSETSYDVAPDNIDIL